jgi:hypothetical protein
MTEQDLDHYMIWSSYFPQSREAMRPYLRRGVQWLARMGVTESPLRLRLPLSPLAVARSHDLINLWLLEHLPNRDKDAEHVLRNLLARLGAGVRPYKA